MIIRANLYYGNKFICCDNFDLDVESEYKTENLWLIDLKKLTATRCIFESMHKISKMVTGKIKYNDSIIEVQLALINGGAENKIVKTNDKRNADYDVIDYEEEKTKPEYAELKFEELIANVIHDRGSINRFESFAIKSCIVERNRKNSSHAVTDMFETPIKQNLPMQKDGETIADILLGEDLKTSNTKTSFGLNFAGLNFKHTIKRKK